MSATIASPSPQYHFAPSMAIRTLIEPLVPNILTQMSEHRVVALAVVGSAARGEETWRDGRLVGDVDLAAVVQSPDPLTMSKLTRAAQELPNGVGLGCFPLYSLQRYRTIEFYEAKRTAWVVWGVQNVFQQVRMTHSNDIPLWEALRLLLNRMMDCLRARANLVPPWYAAVKSYLALGEADLVFSNRYVPSYRGRLHQLESSQETLGSAELLKHVRWATEMKLGSSIISESGDWQSYERWLLDGTAMLMSRYLQKSVPPLDALQLISKQIVRPAHRAAYLIRHLIHPDHWINVLYHDPIFAIWRLVLQVLYGQINLSTYQIQRLLTDWERTHQPLVK